MIFEAHGDHVSYYAVYGLLSVYIDFLSGRLDSIKTATMGGFVPFRLPVILSALELLVGHCLELRNGSKIKQTTVSTSDRRFGKHGFFHRFAGTAAQASSSESATKSKSTQNTALVGATALAGRSVSKTAAQTKIKTDSIVSTVAIAEKVSTNTQNVEKRGTTTQQVGVEDAITQTVQHIKHRRAEENLSVENRRRSDVAADDETDAEDVDHVAKKSHRRKLRGSHQNTKRRHGGKRTHSHTEYVENENLDDEDGEERRHVSHRHHRHRHHRSTGHHRRSRRASEPEENSDDSNDDESEDPDTVSVEDSDRDEEQEAATSNEKRSNKHDVSSSVVLPNIGLPEGVRDMAKAEIGAALKDMIQHEFKDVALVKNREAESKVASTESTPSSNNKNSDTSSVNSEKASSSSSNVSVQKKSKSVVAGKQKEEDASENQGSEVGQQRSEGFPPAAAAETGTEAAGTEEETTDDGTVTVSDDEADPAETSTPEETATGTTATTVSAAPAQAISSSAAAPASTEDAAPAAPVEETPAAPAAETPAAPAKVIVTDDKAEEAPAPTVVATDSESSSTAGNIVVERTNGGTSAVTITKGEPVASAEAVATPLPTTSSKLDETWNFLRHSAATVGDVAQNLLEVQSQIEGMKKDLDEGNMHWQGVQEVLAGRFIPALVVSHQIFTHGTVKCSRIYQMETQRSVIELKVDPMYFSGRNGELRTRLAELKMQHRNNMVAKDDYSRVQREIADLRSRATTTHE